MFVLKALFYCQVIDNLNAHNMWGEAACNFFASFLSVLELFTARPSCLISARPTLHSSEAWTAIASRKYQINTEVQAFHCSMAQSREVLFL